MTPTAAASFDPAAVAAGIRNALCQGYFTADIVNHLPQSKTLSSAVQQGYSPDEIAADMQGVAGVHDTQASRAAAKSGVRWAPAIVRRDHVIPRLNPPL